MPRGALEGLKPGYNRVNNMKILNIKYTVTSPELVTLIDKHHVSDTINDNITFTLESSIACESDH